MAKCPYRSIRPLGEGSVGDVHLCVDVGERSLVVVKWLRAEFNQNSQAALRFRREAERMAGANFLGVIRVKQWGVDDYGRTWMAMEFVDGLPPSAVIPPGDGFAVHRLIRGVSRGLDELHGLGIVHRDLKPDNVLLRTAVDGWEPVIIDLGIAKWLAQDAATATGSVFGTPYYMSPEQFRDTKHVGPATDRYALAVIAFELLSGRRPFEGRTIPDLLRQHIGCEVPSLRVPQVLRAGSLRGESSTDFIEAPQLDGFMARAMAKDPRQRFTSSQEMADAFEVAARRDKLFDSTGQEPLFDPLRTPVVEVSGEGVSRVFDLRQGPVVIGRHEACQVVVNAPRLSRIHACIYTHRGRIWVADLNSQNGTQFGDKHLDPGQPQAKPFSRDQIDLTLYNRKLRLKFRPGS